MSQWVSLDELEADLGQSARLKVLAAAGGQHRRLPFPQNVSGSKIERELGPEIAYWLCGRYGGEKVEFPSARGSETQDRAAELLADVIEAGLTEPTVSANDIAAKHGVSVRWVTKLRDRLRKEEPSPQLSLFE